jgi:hypothetical protein
MEVYTTSNFQTLTSNWQNTSSPKSEKHYFADLTISQSMVATIHGIDPYNIVSAGSFREKKLFVSSTPPKKRTCTNCVFAKIDSKGALLEGPLNMHLPLCWYGLGGGSGGGRKRGQSWEEEEEERYSDLFKAQLDSLYPPSHTRQHTFSPPERRAPHAVVVVL